MTDNDMDRFHFTDTASATLEYAGEGTLQTDDFDPSQAETTTRDGPWVDFFGTDEFIQFEATVAQPIVQPYFHDGEIRFFKKDESELQQAQAQIHYLEWTMGHPADGRVTDASEIRGVWTNPWYEDGQNAKLNIPVTDTDAIRFAVDNPEVSVGFSGVLDWRDDDSNVDAVQRQMAYDHIASVENGRCSSEDGCGLHRDEMDADTHGHVLTDAVQSQSVETPSHSEHTEGDWVSFTVDGERRHGKLIYVDGDRAFVREYDTDSEELTPDSIGVPTTNLGDWVGPFVDDCPGDDCSCGCHLHTDGDSASTTNQPDSTTQTTDSMTTIHEFIDEHDLSTQDVLDSLGVDQKEEPTDFYDGQPDAETLAEDFDAVGILTDEKENLENEIEDVTDELTEYRKIEFEQKASELTDITDRWDEDELLEDFEDGELSVDDIDDRLQLAKDIAGTETTTIENETDDADDTDTSDVTRTSSGRVDLREKTA